MKKDVDYAGELSRGKGPAGRVIGQENAQPKTKKERTDLASSREG